MELTNFLNELASAEPVPGGGSVAALQAAMSASLLAMVSHLTLGRKRFADVEPAVQRMLQEAVALRQRAEELAREDVDAYRRVSQAMALPKSDKTEIEERTRRLQAALKSAAEPPLETMAVAGELARVAGRLVDIGNPSAISDVGVAALAASSAHDAALLNVEINMASVTDKEWVRSAKVRLSEIPDPSDEVRNVYRIVRDRIGSAT